MLQLIRWIKRYPAAKRIGLLIMRLLTPFTVLDNLSALWHYPVFIRDWRRFRLMGGVAPASEFYPCLFDKTATTGIDTHYFYQGIWAFKKIQNSSVKIHVDVGSDVRFVGMLTCIKKVIFVDIRPLKLDIQGYEGKSGTLLDLPFENSSVQSISSISVIEHVGLGRYGDPIDPEGMDKACAELARVLAPGGCLLIGVPVGKTRTCFNAHRIVPATKLIEMMKGLSLVSFSAVDDAGSYHEFDSPEQYDQAEFANGLFHFTKP